MRAVVQRVLQASVRVDGQVVGQIGAGLLVLLGVRRGDTLATLEWMVDKILHLRIFSDSAGKMNLDLATVGGSLLVVSQFTLYGDCNTGRRPDFLEAADPADAKALYLAFVDRARRQGAHVETGQFAAKMEVSLINDGPVTLILDRDAVPVFNS